MNLLVGGSIIAAVTATGTRTVESRRLVAWLTHSYPAAMGWSAIAGLVALRPLTSHAWPTSAITGGLVLAGSIHLFVRTRGGYSQGRAGLWAFTLSLTLVSALCAAGSMGEGREFPPSLGPRLLHILLAEVAVAGMLVALHGMLQRGRDERYGRWAVERGMRWFVIPTALQMVVGFYFLLALPGPARSRLLGGSATATIELVAGILLAIAAFSAVTHATNAADPRRPLIAGALLLAATLIVMALLREQVKVGYGPAGDAQLPELHPSGTEVAIPLALMAATGIGMTAWLLRRLRSAPPA